MNIQNQKQRLHIKKGLFYGVLLSVFLLLALQSAKVIPALQEALLLCYRTVIPSLFPFFVLSGILISTGFAEECARYLSGLMRPLFGVNGAGSLSLVIGLMSGYPMGAKMTAELYKNGQITRTEAERLLPFCNNSGPLFIVGAVGTGMLGSTQVGLFLYSVHALCALLVGLCFRFYKKGEGIYRQERRHQGVSNNLSSGFSASVSGAVNTMLLVCGFILLFAAVGACLSAVLEDLLPSAFMLGIKGLLEVTSGVFLVTKAGLSPRLLLTVISSFLGFGGLCVMMQTAGILAGTDISLKTYSFGKLLHGILSGIVAFLCYPYLRQPVRPVFALVNHLPVGVPILNAVSLLCSCMVILCCLFLCIKFKNKR